MPNRRAFLTGLVGSTAILAAGAGTFVASRRPDAALAPWGDAVRESGDARLDALSSAILAPNPHNRQPWLLGLSGEDEIIVRCDLDRRLPETDPHDRQILIGFGCFLETLSIAATARGRKAEINLFPEGEPGERLDARPIAHVRLTPGASPDPLHRQIPHRRSNKEVFEDRPVDPNALAALVASAPGVRVEADPARVAALRDLAFRAHMVEVETPRTLKESADLMRFTKRQIEANPDGIDLGGPLFEALHHAGLLTEQTVVDPGSTAFAQGVEAYRGMIMSAAAWLWIPGGNGRVDQVAAGRAWMRMHLAATELGVAVHPMSQALQEYPEMDSLYRELHETLDAGPGRRVQMLARLGYGPEIDPSPRWPLETRIIQG